MAFFSKRCTPVYMARAKTIKPTGRVIVARLEPGDDILHSIEKISIDFQIISAEVSMIGAVSKAHLGFFNREKKEYQDFKLNEDLEIVSGTGNISRYEDAHIVHIHIVAADKTGRCYGGHLLEGCEVSVTIEIIITEVSELERKLDKTTGLKMLNI